MDEVAVTPQLIAQYARGVNVHVSGAGHSMAGSLGRKPAPIENEMRRSAQQAQAWQSVDVEFRISAVRRILKCRPRQHLNPHVCQECNGVRMWRFCSTGTPVTHTKAHQPPHPLRCMLPRC